MAIKKTAVKTNNTAKSPTNSSFKRKLITALFVLAEYIFIIALYFAQYSILIRIFLALASLIIVGIIITKINNLIGGYGSYIYGGNFGINFIDKLSKNCKGFWIFISEWGLVMGFGLLSYIIFKNKISKKALVSGVVSILLFIIVLYPYLLVAFQFINIPNLTNTIAQTTSISTPSLQFSILGYILLVISVIGGFSFFIFIALISGAVQMLTALFSVVSSVVASTPNYTPLATAVPGLAPLLPGITIPLFAGILSLIVILVVHEFSHGILSRVYGIKVKKVGIAILGVIPIGAFVEPDENKLKKIDKNKQNNIFIAGISANFIFAIIFFLFLVVFLIYIIPTMSSGTYLYISGVFKGSPSYNVIPLGSILKQWNGVNVTNISVLEAAAKADKPFTKVTVLTNVSEYNLTANSTGKIGVLINSETIPKSGLYYTIMLFLYQFIALSFMLNFLVAVLNLLPLPFFDGWRIYKNILSNRKLKILSIFTVLLLLLLALPWFFIL